jgi:hypothetical protein
MIAAARIEKLVKPAHLVYRRRVRYLPVLAACPLGHSQDNAEIGLEAARWSRGC